jgi:hypothetical protein
MDIKTISGRIKLVTNMVKTKMLDQILLKHYYLTYYQESFGMEKAKEKEILKFIITSNPNYWNSICLGLVTHNGNVKTINKKYLCGGKRTKSKDINKVFRKSIEYQVIKFRNENNIPKTHHIDHIYSFDKMVIDYFKDVTEEEYEKIRVKDDVLTPQHIIHNWVIYHKTHAKLQGLLALDNLKKGNR